jgi:Nickel responsive protein SCO4226-like
MPLFIDTHKKVEGLTTEAVTTAHKMDLAVQERYDVKYLRYWFNVDAGRVYCLVEAPSAEAAQQVHQEAHGLLADDIVEVTEGSKAFVSLSAKEE